MKFTSKVYLKYHFCNVFENVMRKLYVTAVAMSKTLRTKYGKLKSKIIYELGKSSFLNKKPYQRRHLAIKITAKISFIKVEVASRGLTLVKSWGI